MSMAQSVMVATVASLSPVLHLSTLWSTPDPAFAIKHTCSSSAPLCCAASHTVPPFYSLCFVLFFFFFILQSALCEVRVRAGKKYRMSPLSTGRGGSIWQSCKEKKKCSYQTLSIQFTSVLFHQVCSAFTPTQITCVCVCVCALLLDTAVVQPPLLRAPLSGAAWTREWWGGAIAQPIKMNIITDSPLWHLIGICARESSRTHRTAAGGLDEWRREKKNH